MHSFRFSVSLAARSLLCAFSCIVLTASCAYSPSTTLPETDTQALQKAKSVDATSQITTSWWKVFEVAELAPVMKTLESQNLTLNQAEQRVKRAQFLLAQVNAGDVPTITARTSGRSGRDLDSGRSSHSTSGGLGLSYDADIWGTRDAQQRSRQLGIDTAQYQFTDALLDTQALFINTLLEQISLQSRLSIAMQNVEISEALLNLVQIRFEEGDTSGIEVSQQRNTLISAQSEVLRLSNSLTLNERALAVLLGNESMQFNTPEQKALLSLSLTDFSLPEVAPILSAEVLKQRPDVQLAIAQFKQADLAFYEASVAGLPGMSLSADIGVSDLLDLAQGWTLGAAISSAATLFDGGRLEAAEKAAKTDVDLAILQYQQTVLSAIETLLNSQTNLVFNQQNYRYALASLENNQQLYRLADIRYKAGDTDFLNLLNAQRSFFSARQSVISNYQAVLSSVIATYRESAGADITSP